jgi:hypothetical protein
MDDLFARQMRGQRAIRDLAFSGWRWRARRAFCLSGFHLFERQFELGFSDERPKCIRLSRAIWILSFSIMRSRLKSACSAASRGSLRLKRHALRGYDPT